MVDRRNNQKTVDQINAEYGKLPPQATDVEEAVLGALMLEQDAYQIVSGILDENCFYKEEHRKVFLAVKEVSESDNPVDLLSVTQLLKNKGQLDAIGGAAHITRLVGKVSSAAHIEFHARIIAQKFIQREVIRIASEIQLKAYDEMIDIDDLMSFARSEFGEVENIMVTASPGKTTDVVAQEAIADIEADVIANKEGATPGISTGLKDLDASTGGWRDTNLITIAARPGVGKTSFALYLAVAAARQGKWVNFYGLEMKSADLFRILLSSETDIDRSDIRDGRIEDPEWAKINLAVKELEKLPIIWNDNADITVDQIVANTRRNKKAGRCDLVIVDYLQLVTPGDKKAIREQQIAEITRKFKKTALRENIPVIDLSQLNRQVENRPGKEPNLSDLRESGAIEQDSDVIIFLYMNDEGIHLKISKNRRGKTGHPDFWANDEKTVFADREPDGQMPFEMEPNENFNNDDQPF